MVHRCSLFRLTGGEVSSGDAVECFVVAVAKRAEGPARKIVAEMKLPDLKNHTLDCVFLEITFGPNLSSLKNLLSPSFASKLTLNEMVLALSDLSKKLRNLVLVEEQLSNTYT